MQNRFEIKKRKILELLGTPDENYQDLSPKGSVDESILPLIGDINHLTGLVTTSSCSGRVSVFCEGKRRDSDDAEAERVADVVRAGPGGKGRGCWLYTSHSPIEVSSAASGSDWMGLFGLKSSSRGKHAPAADSSYIHLKFEPMILHILAESLDDSQRVLTAALSAGFRESGAVSLSAQKTGELNPMVAVRSTGYSFDTIIGYQDEKGEHIGLVDEAYLGVLVGIANGRFKVNSERIARFRSALLEQYTQRQTTNKSISGKPDWEDPETRRRRKREEGLAQQQRLLAQPQRKANPTMENSTEGDDLEGGFTLLA